MWLFDDLLGGAKKADPVMPVTDASSVVMPAQNVTPESIDAMLNISAGNVTAEMPSYTAQKAEQATSPVIVSEAPMMMENSPIVTPVETVPTVMSEAPTVAANPIVETPMVAFDTPATPVVTEVAAPVVDFSMPTPAEIAPVSPVVMAPTTDSASLILETPTVVTPEVTPVITAQEISTSHTEMNPIFSENLETKTEEIANISPISSISEVSEAPKVEENSLFGLVAENVATPTESPAFAFAEEVSQEEKSENITTEMSVIPENTENFLAAGLLQLEKMEKTLADRKQKFLDQAEEYRSEKEKFAELERQAIENSHSMDDEQKKIDAMKKYFNKQLEGPNINDSVDTALTGIAVQNAVGSTIEKKVTRKKAIA